MNLSSRELILLTVAIIGGGVFAYLGYQKTDVSDQQPRYEGEAVTAGLAGAFKVFDHLNTGDHYFHPGYCTDGQSLGFTPHRYPAVSGGNITALVHQGFDAMMRPAPQDADWFSQPPGSEVLL